MPEFEIEQYELHAQKYRVEAENMEEAMRIFFETGGEAVDNTLEFIEVAHDYSSPELLTEEEYDSLAEDHNEWLADDGGVTSIRGVEEV